MTLCVSSKDMSFEQIRSLQECRKKNDELLEEERTLFGIEVHNVSILCVLGTAAYAIKKIADYRGIITPLFAAFSAVELAIITTIFSLFIVEVMVPALKSRVQV